MNVCATCRHSYRGQDAKYLRCAKSTAPADDDASLAGEMRLNACPGGKLWEAKEPPNGQA